MVFNFSDSWFYLAQFLNFYLNDSKILIFVNSCKNSISQTLNQLIIIRKKDKVCHLEKKILFF